MTSKFFRKVTKATNSREKKKVMDADRVLNYDDNDLDTLPPQNKQ